MEWRLVTLSAENSYHLFGVLLFFGVSLDQLRRKWMEHGRKIYVRRKDRHKGRRNKEITMGIREEKLEKE